MPRSSRTLAIAAVLVAGLTASGCSLVGVPTEDDYPDDYEQAIADTLDDAEIVVQHEAEIDAWHRSSSIPPFEARVEITPRASNAEASELLEQLLQLAADHEQPLPTLVFDIPDIDVSFMFSGSLDTADANDALTVAFTEGWPRVSVFGAEDGMSTSLHAVADTVAEATSLLTGELPASVTADVNYSTVTVTEIESVGDVSASDSLVLPAALDVALALNGMKEGLPTADGTASFDISSSTHPDSGDVVDFAVEIRADGLNDAEPDDRPAIAQQMGYTDYCHTVETAAREAAGDTALHFQCVATHVDID